VSVRCLNNSSAVAKRPHDASCLSVVTIQNSTKHRVETYRWHSQANTNLAYVHGSYSCSTVLSIDFNVFNWCSEHSVIANQCWIKYHCIIINNINIIHKVIIIIFISDNYRQLANILSSSLMLTHIVCRIFRMLRPTNFKLSIWMEDDDSQQPQTP